MSFGDTIARGRRATVRWSEGPAWFAAGRYLVWSDIPNDRMLRWDDTDGSVSVFRQPAFNTNGHTVDREGRLVSCEHRARCISRTVAALRSRAWPGGNWPITVMEMFKGPRVVSPPTRGQALASAA